MCIGKSSTSRKEVGGCFLFGEKSDSLNSSESVVGVILYFGLEAYSKFEILEKMSLGGKCKGFPDHPKIFMFLSLSLSLSLSHSL